MAVRPRPEPCRAEIVEIGDEHTRHVVVWDFAEPVMALSSAPVGGSAGIDWLVNVGVVDDYTRTDLAAHVADVSERLGLEGTGAGMLTAADVRRLQRSTDGDVTVDATVGVTKPTWAADGDHAYAHLVDGDWVETTAEAGGLRDPGTINVVVQLPVALTPAAAVNAVVTATEAKAQALAEAGIPGTGTASDALAVCFRPDLPAVDFAGPRSEWGARIARATHAAVAAGLAAHP